MIFQQTCELAIYKLNYNLMRITVQEVEYIRGEIEAALKEYVGVAVISSRIRTK